MASRFELDILRQIFQTIEVDSHSPLTNIDCDSRLKDSRPKTLTG